MYFQQEFYYEAHLLMPTLKSVMDSLNELSQLNWQAEAEQSHSMGLTPVAPISPRMYDIKNALFAHRIEIFFNEEARLVITGTTRVGIHYLDNMLYHILLERGGKVIWVHLDKIDHSIAMKNPVIVKKYLKPWSEIPKWRQFFIR